MKDPPGVPSTSAVAHELRFTLSRYRDPGDRFLVATAKVYDLTLATADQRLLQVPSLPILPNCRAASTIADLRTADHFPVPFFCNSSSVASTSALCFSGFTSSHTFCTTPLGSMRKV